MQAYNWNDLLNMPEDQIWRIDTGNNPVVKVNAADKSFEILSRPLIMSWYAWTVFRMYPELALHGKGLEKRHFLTGNTISNKSINNIITHSYRDHDKMLMKKLGSDLTGGVLDVVAINRALIKNQNYINNTFVAKIPEYVTTSNMRDYMEILDDPYLTEVRQAIQPNQNSIGEAYRKSLAYIKDPKNFPTNQVANDIKQGEVSDGQTAQVFVARGFLTDHNSRIFVRPVVRCYAEGLGSFYDSFIESRSATKAMIFQKKPLEDSEWFNRKMQLVCQSVQRIHLGEDCGSQVTVPVALRKGWAKRLAGKYYVDTDGTTKYIHEDDSHLEGRVLQIRSAMYCNHQDKGGICERCYGKLAVSLPYFNVLSKVGFNEIAIGHVSATSIGEKLSQKMLSTKHLDTSSTVDPFIIKRSDAIYLTPGMRDNAARLHPRLRDEKYSLKVNFTKLTALTDIYMAEDLDEVATRVGGFDEIILEFTRDGDYVESIPIKTTQGSRQAQFTVEFLRFLQTANWTNTDKGFVTVDMSNFSYECDIIELPLVHEDMMAYQKQIEGYVRFTKESAKWKGKPITPDDAGVILGEFFDLISQRLDVNVVHAEVMLYAIMARDPTVMDYSLPRAHEPRQVCAYDDCIENRSLSVQLLYQEQASILMKPSTYLVENRLSHPADSLFVE